MKKILIIEDNVEIASLMKDFLSGAGFEVLVCYDGLQGTEFTRRHRPDLIILDLMLPAGGGFFVLDKVKLSTLTRTIPIVVLTASKDPEHRQKAMAMGVDIFLEKPYENEDLLATIKQVLRIDH